MSMLGKRTELSLTDKGRIGQNSLNLDALAVQLARLRVHKPFGKVE